MPKKKEPLTKFYNENVIEIGVDEAGRGPMFGRVYSAAVVLPNNDEFNYELLKDSKKFSSEKKLLEAYDYVINNALYWSVSWNDEKHIDKMNIRQSTLNCMHKSIKNIIQQLKTTDRDILLLIDGNDFKPYMRFNNNQYEQLDHVCIKGGDNTYCSIAAASIIAKVERDKYIYDLCEKNTFLQERYNIKNNKGYGTKKHMDGIKSYGISEWHRKTYGICRQYT